MCLHTAQKPSVFLESDLSSNVLSQLQINHKMILDSPELLPELQPDKPIEGLSSMVEMLSNFQRVLHSLPKGHMSQLHNDVSTLLHNLEDRMSSLQCIHRKMGAEKNLEVFVKNHSMFHITLGHMALDRLQKYLQRINHHLDELRTCWTCQMIPGLFFYYCNFCYIYLY